MKVLSATILTGLLLSPICHADRNSRVEIGHQCIDVANALHALAGTNRASLCATDMEVTSAFVEAAGNELYRGNSPKALRLIINSQNELWEMREARIYCAPYAKDIRFFLNRVNTLKIDILNLDVLNGEQHD